MKQTGENKITLAEAESFNAPTQISSVGFPVVPLIDLGFPSGNGHPFYSADAKRLPLETDVVSPENIALQSPAITDTLGLVMLARDHGQEVEFRIGSNGEMEDVFLRDRDDSPISSSDHARRLQERIKKRDARHSSSPLKSSSREGEANDAFDSYQEAIESGAVQVDELPDFTRAFMEPLVESGIVKRVELDILPQGAVLYLKAGS